MKIARRDSLQLISGLCLMVGVIFCFTLPIIYVCAVGMLAFIFAIISVTRQRFPLQKRHRIIGIIEIILSVLLLSLAMGVAVHYALQMLRS